MTQAILERHGAKNDSPEAHQTGVEALLDPNRIDEIKEAARNLANKKDVEKITFIVTPVERSVATARIYYDEIRKTNPDLEMVSIIDDMAGSYAIHPETGEPVNLSPKEMSKIWGEAKKHNTDGDKETSPLKAWFEQGLDNPQAAPLTSSPEEKMERGISLREIGLRYGTHLHELLETIKEKELAVVIGHSGDIETWLALTVLMQKGIDDGEKGSSSDNLVETLDEIGGALAPIEEINIDPKKEIVKITRGNKQFTIDKAVLEKQAEIYHRFNPRDEN